MLHIFLVTHSDGYGLMQTTVVAAENRDRARVLAAEEAYSADSVEEVFAIETPVVEGVMFSVS